jgi:hypothetical protein
MTRTPHIGFRVVGTAWTRRIVVDHAAAFAGYAACHPKAGIDKEGYLSAFRFTRDFQQYFTANGNSEKDFQGVCWADWLWLDVDRDDLQCALDDARRLAATILDRFRDLDADDLLAFYSGSKGFHVGVPTSPWRPAPDEHFNLFARRFCGRIAELAGVRIDDGVYTATRLFRAPNTRHPKTGLHKRRLDLDALMNLNLDGIQRLAEKPEPFDLRTPKAASGQAAADWRDAMSWVQQQAEGKAVRRAAALNGSPTLNRQTLAFIRDGAEQGDRHRLLYSAAANLAEFRCPPALAHALLTDAALDTGLSPADVRRQIECGLKHGTKQPEGNGNG